MNIKLFWKAVLEQDRATLPSSMSPQALPGHGRKRKSTGQESIAYLDITMKMKNIYKGRTV